MERNEYLKRCQQYACYPSPQLEVFLHGAPYRPQGYLLEFNPDGSSRHIAVLRDKAANCLIHALLERVTDSPSPHTYD